MFSQTCYSNPYIRKKIIIQYTAANSVRTVCTTHLHRLVPLSSIQYKSRDHELPGINPCLYQLRHSPIKWIE